MYRPRLGSILMFEGDTRKITIPFANITAFSAVDHVLSQREDDVTSTYQTTSPEYVGNVLKTAIIGDKASMPAGRYRYFLTGTYDGGKERTWYIDILVIPKNTEQWYGVDMTSDYPAILDEITMYEGDDFNREAIFPSMAFSAVTGVFKQADDESPDAYCLGDPSYDGSRLISSAIGGADTVPAGEYAYFITGTWGDGKQKTTWVWLVNCLPKVSAE